LTELTELTEFTKWQSQLYEGNTVFTDDIFWSWTVGSDNPSLQFRDGVRVGWKIVRVTYDAYIAGRSGSYLLRVVVERAYQTKRADGGRKNLPQYQKSESVDKQEEVTRSSDEE
jgi:hypothetical protein